MLNDHVKSDSFGYKEQTNDPRCCWVFVCYSPNLCVHMKKLLAHSKFIYHCIIPLFDKKSRKFTAFDVIDYQLFNIIRLHWSMIHTLHIQKLMYIANITFALTSTYVLVETKKYICLPHQKYWYAYLLINSSIGEKRKKHYSFRYVGWHTPT